MILQIKKSKFEKFTLEVINEGVMKRMGQLRETVVTILNELLGDPENGIVFNPDDTKKNGRSNKKKSKHDQLNSINWSARCQGKYYVTVYCIGMTMAEFVSEYRNNRTLCFRYERPLQRVSIKWIEFTLYKNIPTWRTTGSVLKIDTEQNKLVLKFRDVLDPVELKITELTPPWLLDENEKIEFSCRIYPFWRHNNLHLINEKNSDLAKVWKTFRIARFVSDQEY